MCDNRQGLFVFVGLGGVFFLVLVLFSPRPMGARVLFLIEVGRVLMIPYTPPPLLFPLLEAPVCQPLLPPFNFRLSY